MAITTKDIKDAFSRPPRSREDMDAAHDAFLREKRARMIADAGGPVRFDDGDLVLTSGRRVECNNRMFSIRAEGAEFEIGYGYDGFVYYPSLDDTEEEFKLTADDMREIADLMIGRWQAFKASLEK